MYGATEVDSVNSSSMTGDRLTNPDPGSPVVGYILLVPSYYFLETTNQMIPFPSGLFIYFLHTDNFMSCISNPAIVKWFTSWSCLCHYCRNNAMRLRTSRAAWGQGASGPGLYGSSAPWMLLQFSRFHEFHLSAFFFYRPSIYIYHDNISSSCICQFQMPFDCSVPVLAYCRLPDVGGYWVPASYHCLFSGGRPEINRSRDLTFT